MTNVKDRLFRYFVSAFNQTPEFTVRTVGPHHCPSFQVSLTVPCDPPITTLGEGKTKKEAEGVAAFEAFTQLCQRGIIDPLPSLSSSSTSSPSCSSSFVTHSSTVSSPSSSSSALSGSSTFSSSSSALSTYSVPSSFLLPPPTSEENPRTIINDFFHRTYHSAPTFILQVSENLEKLSFFTFYASISASVYLPSSPSPSSSSSSSFIHTFEGKGRGESRKLAEKEASRELLEKLRAVCPSLSSSSTTPSSSSSFFPSLSKKRTAPVSTEIERDPKRKPPFASISSSSTPSDSSQGSSSFDASSSSSTSLSSFLQADQRILTPNAGTGLKILEKKSDATAKEILFSLLLERFKIVPVYQLHISGPRHTPTFSASLTLPTILDSNGLPIKVKGTGKTKRLAEQIAARRALSELAGLGLISSYAPSPSTSSPLSSSSTAASASIDSGFDSTPASSAYPSASFSSSSLLPSMTLPTSTPFTTSLVNTTRRSEEEERNLSAELQIYQQQLYAYPPYIEQLVLRCQLPLFAHRSTIVQRVTPCYSSPSYSSSSSSSFFLPSKVVLFHVSEEDSQIPQFILEEMLIFGFGGKCKILGATQTEEQTLLLSLQAARERTESIGTSVGYELGESKGRRGKKRGREEVVAEVEDTGSEKQAEQEKGEEEVEEVRREGTEEEESKPLELGSILFCTFEVLRKKLEKDLFLSDYSHIIVYLSESDFQNSSSSSSCTPPPSSSLFPSIKAKANWELINTLLVSLTTLNATASAFASPSSNTRKTQLYLIFILSSPSTSPPSPSCWRTVADWITSCFGKVEVVDLCDPPSASSSSAVFSSTSSLSLPSSSYAFSSAFANIPSLEGGKRRNVNS